MSLAPGTMLSRYRIESVLGTGGMGEVYKARDETLGRPVAIKIVRQDLAVDDARLRRFAGEAKTASAMNHPHIVHVYDVGEADGVHFIAMEYVEGRTLRQLINERTPLLTLLRYLTQVADALAKAHAGGIVHRDLKPDNILVSQDGYAKVADFGLAKLRRTEDLHKAFSNTSLTAEGAVVGTPGYMAPEQVLGQEVDHRADIFAFGCILYEAISGSRPFEATSGFELMKKIAYDPPRPLPPTAPQLREIVTRALAKSPSSRYDSLAEVASDLHGVIRRLESDADVPTERAPHLAGRRSAPLHLVVSLLIIGALVAGMVLLNSQRRSERMVPATAPPPTQSETRGTTRAPSADPRGDYLRAKVLVSEQNPTSNERAIQLLEGVVAADPKFALAYADLARAYAIKAFAFAAAADRAKYNEEAAVAVEKALALDPNLAEAHLARGRYLWSQLNGFPHEEAADAFKRAISLKPNLDEAHHELGQIYLHVGLLEKAMHHLRIALTENPSNLQARYRTGTVQLLSGQCSDALRIFKSTPLAKNPPVVTWATSTAMICLERDEEALQLVDRYLQGNPKDEGGLGSSVLAVIHAKRGRTQVAEKAIADAVARGRGYGHFHHAAFNVGCAYALLGRPGEAVRWLREAANDGFPCYPVFVSEKTLSGIRSDPEFVTLMADLKRDHERRLRTM